MLTYDPHDPDDPNAIYYKGRKVGSTTFKDGVTTVSLNLTYEAEDGDWIVPLSHLGIGLTAIEPPAPPTALEVHTAEGDVEPHPGQALLLEALVKAKGYQWQFHKSDPDPWPSPLHGHDYGKGLSIRAERSSATAMSFLTVTGLDPRLSHQAPRNSSSVCWSESWVTWSMRLCAGSGSPIQMSEWRQ